MYDSLKKQKELLSKLYDLISFGVPKAQAEYEKGNDHAIRFISAQLEVLAQIEKINTEQIAVELGVTKKDYQGWTPSLDVFEKPHN